MSITTELRNGFLKQIKTLFEDDTFQTNRKLKITVPSHKTGL